jgi:uncharacterized protein (DUF488 family)
MSVSTQEHRSLAQLTQAIFGQTLTINETFELVMREEYAPSPAGSALSLSLWVGSVGYERYKLNDEFARRLCDAGVERLIDVRELPISRRRGYAKTALGEAMAAVGIEYVHIRALGNPKAFRDLYKSGRVAEGRDHYEQYLLDEQSDALRGLVPLLQEKRSALMCVEHDPAVCHRTVIVDSLRSELGIELEVAEIA